MSLTTLINTGHQNFANPSYKPKVVFVGKLNQRPVNKLFGKKLQNRS